jgi:hypothetical protein
VLGDFDPLAANDEGCALLDQGRLAEGLALLGASARAGIPWALATYSWRQLIRGNAADALALAAAALPACRVWVDQVYGDLDLADASRYQLINARSNLALCGIALGHPASEALAVWEEGVDHGHPESAFYPAILAFREGNSIAAKGAASAIPSSVLAGLRVSFRDDARGAAPWFVEWCGDGLAVLELIASVTCLCGKIANPPCRLFLSGKNHTSLSSGDNLVTVKAEGAQEAEGAGMPASPCRA